MNKIKRLFSVITIIGLICLLCACGKAPQTKDSIIRKMEKQGYELEYEDTYYDNQTYSLEFWGENNEYLCVDIYTSNVTAKNAYEKEYKDNIYIINDTKGVSGKIVYYGDPEAVKILLK